MLSKDEAICIRAIDFSETSQIVTFFTKDNGKISAIAKGSKRAKSAFDGPIEILSSGRIVFSNPEDKLATLTEFEQKVSNRTVLNLFTINCGFLAAELINNLIEDNDPHPELYIEMEGFLENIRQLNENSETLTFLILFELALLKNVGLQPILQECTNCKRDFSDDWGVVYFSSMKNGIVCRDCEASFSDKVRIRAKTANCLANLKQLGNSNLDVLLEIEKVLLSHFTEILHKRPKMAKFVLEGASK